MRTFVVKTMLAVLLLAPIASMGVYASDDVTTTTPTQAQQNITRAATNMADSVPDAAQLNRLQDSGIQSVRAGLAWSEVESVRGTYDWTNSDPKLLPYFQRGIKVQLLICCSPAWMGAYSNWWGPWHSQYTADFGNFVRAVIQHYGPLGLRVIEISNEPDWAYPTDKAWVYGAYLQAAYEAAHISLGPEFIGYNVTVLNGGLAYEGQQSLDFVTINANALRQYTDVVAFHWYPPEQYGTAYPDPYTKLDALKAQIGTPAGKQYFLNEIGVDSAWNGWTEQRQASDLTYWIGTLGQRPNELIGFCWFAFRDDQWGAGFEDAGLVRHDNSLKPAYFAMQSILMGYEATDTWQVGGQAR